MLQKISSESIHLEDIKSLQIMSEEEEEESKFIRCIQAMPFSVIMFNEAGIRLFHELAPHTTLFCDATGTVVKMSGEYCTMH